MSQVPPHPGLRLHPYSEGWEKARWDPCLPSNRKERERGAQGTCLEKAGVKSRDIPLQPQAALRLSVPNCLREQSPLGRGGDRAAPPPPA